MKKDNEKKTEQNSYRVSIYRIATEIHAFTEGPAIDMEKKLKNHFRIKKMFSSLLLSYGALVMLPFISVFVLLQFWNASTEKYYKEIVDHSLTEGRMAFEKRLDVLHAGAFSILYDSDLSWVSFLQGLAPGDTNITTLMNCNEMLNDAFADSTNYYNYCVVLENGFVFRKKGMCIGKEFFYNNYRKYEEISYDEWYEKSFEATTWQLFPMQQIRTEESAEEAMTYSYPIRGNLQKEGKARVVVQFLLTKQDMADMFSALGNMQGVVYIFDDKGACLANFFEETESEPLTMENLPEEGGYEIRVLDGVEKLVMQQPSSDGKLVFAVALPAEIALMNLKQTERIAWIVLAAGFLFEVILGWRFAMRYSGPIKNVIGNMQRMFTASETNASEPVGGTALHGKHLSEYEYLEKGVNALLDTNQSMRHTLKEKRAREKTNFLMLLLNGEFHTDREVEEEALYVGVDLTSPWHYVLVFYTETGRDQVIRYMEDMTYPFVKAVYGVDAYKIALLIACEEAQPETARRDRRLLLEGLEREGSEQGEQPCIYVGVGRAYAGKSDLCFSFRQACYCADKAFREGNRTEEVEYSRVLLELNMPWYPAGLEERLVNAARCGKTETVQEIFTGLREENFEKRHLSLPMGRMITSNLTSALLGLYNNISENENIMEFVERAEKESDPQNTFRLLEEQFMGLGERMNASRDRKTEEYYDRLQSYMETKYQDEQFGMPVAAEDFGLSESYFSTFFKEVMGKAFSSYLENMRLEKSKELISEGKYDLEQISRMVGYNSSATFRRAFKRAYGVAPSAYKNQKQ